MAYLTVHQRVGNLIDWYNIQVCSVIQATPLIKTYALWSSSTTVSVRCVSAPNQCSTRFTEGTTEYTTCNSLLTSSSTQSALFQIAANGVPVSKLVIGKPATTSDATNGFMPTSMLAQCLQQAKNRGWSEYLSCLNLTCVLNQHLQMLASWFGSIQTPRPIGLGVFALSRSRSKVRTGIY